MVYVNMSMELAEAEAKIDTIAASLLGQRLQDLIQTARFLPVEHRLNEAHQAGDLRPGRRREGSPLAPHGRKR